MKCGALNGENVCNREAGHPGEHCQGGWLGNGEYFNIWWSHNPGPQATAEEARDVGSEPLAAAPEPHR